MSNKADSAAHAKALSAEAQQILNKVSNPMQRMLTAIQDVTMSSEETGKINQQIDEIGVASHEQSQGIGQIGRAVADIDKVMQSVATNTEESASAAEEMSSRTKTMDGNVGNLFSSIFTGEKGSQQ